MPTSDKQVVNNLSRTAAEVKQTTVYYDGLGRKMQTVEKAISTSAKDMVKPVIYDAFGKEVYDYLPYTQISGNNSDGNIKLNPFYEQGLFYKDGQLNPGGVGEDIYYAETIFEPSPLGRISKAYGVGNSWAKTGGARAIEMQYLVNEVSDSVVIWNIGEGMLPVSAGYYPPGKLIKNVTINTTGVKSVEYTDRDGQTILKKMQKDAVTSNGYTGWLSTYYIYDDVGNLRVVLSPLATEQIIGTWNVAPVAFELCYFYQYDGRNRLIVKKVPGSEMVEMVYDNRDRLAFSRDGNGKSLGQWLVNLYDSFNRPVETALYASTTSRLDLQQQMNTIPAFAGSTPLPYTIPGTVDLELAFYDGKALYEAQNSVFLNPGFDVANSEVMLQINPQLTGSTTTVAASQVLPAMILNNLTPLTFTYYDNYNFSGVRPLESTLLGKPTAGNNPYPDSIVVSSYVHGLITGTSTRILGTDTWLTTTNYYDRKARVIQSVGSNISGGKEVVTTMYDFSSKILSSYYAHINLRSGLTPSSTILTAISYDAAGRIKEIRKRINDADSLDRIVARMEYDELGKVKINTLGLSSTNTVGLEKVSYQYTINGWLKSIGKEYLDNQTAAGHFGEELFYDKGFNINSYNGNIAGVLWRGWNDPVVRAYGYKYDNIGQLTGADFAQKSSSSGLWKNDVVDFTVGGISYDANGNIKQLSQNGLVGTSSSNIDNLTYSYKPGSNKLLGVTDASPVTQRLGDFKNGTNTGADYRYDTSGNLTKDLNKNISSITYNHLNLPTQITVDAKGVISYVYDAAGRKLQKKVSDNTVTPARTIVTDYMGVLTYQNDTLQQLNHEEGRVRVVAQSNGKPRYVYDYFVKDHLGNPRLLLTEEANLTVYAASMEESAAATEGMLFSNVNETRIATPVGYPNDADAPDNKSVSKLTGDGSGKKIGPSLVLRVMAGDTIRMGVKAFYKSDGPANKPQSVTTDLLPQLLMAFGGNSAGGSGHALADGQLPASPFNAGSYSNIYQRMNERDQEKGNPNRISAFLNFALFDDQFRLVDDNCGLKAVKATPDELQTLSPEELVMQKSGFLYIYTSNESQQDVYFDNLIVTQQTGTVVEETHYYPYGLTMAGISSNALKGTSYKENKNKFNGGSILQSGEFADGSGLELYETPLRTLDPQLGRWHQIDSKPQEMFSPYAAMANNPISMSDPMGDTTWVFGTAGQYLGTINDNLPNQAHFIDMDDVRVTAFDASKSTAKEARILAKRMREVSVAYIGAKGAEKLKAIASDATKINEEIAFVGTIGKNKELQFTALPVDKDNGYKYVRIPIQVDKKYSQKDQVTLFLFGHIHHNGMESGGTFTTTGGPVAAHAFFGKPTFPDDYVPALFRTANATDRGQSPALIATPYGVTIYGSGARMERGYGGSFVKEEVMPVSQSYLLYKSFKP